MSDKGAEPRGIIVPPSWKVTDPTSSNENEVEARGIVGPPSWKVTLPTPQPRSIFEPYNGGKSRAKTDGM
jgi:hypothetical protein